MEVSCPFYQKEYILLDEGSNVTLVDFFFFYTLKDSMKKFYKPLLNFCHLCILVRFAATKSFLCPIQKKIKTCPLSPLIEMSRLRAEREATLFGELS